jgi:hypothetical protein
LRDPDLPGSPLPGADHPCPLGWLTAPTASPLRPLTHRRRTLHLLSIAYAPHDGRPRLRSRLTLGRLPLPRNPQAFGVTGSHSQLRYSFRHSHFGSLHQRSRSGFTATPERSPTTAQGSRLTQSAASVLCLSPGTLSAQGHSTSELLRTLSRMAASEPTSWLSARPHYLAHSAEILGP